MSSQRNKVHHVTTIARVAIELEENEDLLWILADQMDTEDGLIWVYGPEEEGVIAFSDDGIECLKEIIAIYKENRDCIDQPGCQK